MVFVTTQILLSIFIIYIYITITLSSVAAVDRNIQQMKLKRGLLLLFRYHILIYFKEVVLEALCGTEY